MEKNEFIPSELKKKTLKWIFFLPLNKKKKLQEKFAFLFYNKLLTDSWLSNQKLKFRI